MPSSLLYWIISIAGPFVALFAAFWYGHSQAKKAAELQDLRRKEALQNSIDKAEKDNQAIEDKRHESIEKLRASDLPRELIELWNKGPWGPKT